MKSPFRTRVITIVSLLTIALCAAAPSPTSGQSRRVSPKSSGAPPPTIVLEEEKLTEPESPGTQPPVVLVHDDNTFETSIGIVSEDGVFGSQAVFVNRFTPDPQVLPLTVDKVSMLFPVTQSNLVASMHFQVLVYVDASGSGNPGNTTLVRRQDISILPSDSMFQEIALSSPVRIESGDIWVGFTNSVTAEDGEYHEAPIFPAAQDTNGPRKGSSWVFFDPTIGDHFDGFDLGAAEVGAVIDQLGLPGNWLIRASGQSGATVELTWEAPDPNAGENPPPRFLQVQTIGDGREAAAPAAAEPAPQTPGGAIVGYKIYRSNTSPVARTPNNIFASVPPNQTSARSATASTGSFYIVTACYENGAESAPSNEASGGIPGPAITKLKISSKKVVGDGTGWVFPVTVFFDNVGFQAATKVKNKPTFTRVTQKGRLANGQTITQYLTPGREVLVTFRNANGATTAIPVEIQ